MALVIREVHAPADAGALNEEWFVVENTGDRPFSTAGCAVSTGKSKGGRLKQVGTLDPGFTLAASQKIRLVTGSPGKKAHGKPPAETEELKNYHLFLGTAILGGGPGTVVALSLKQHELARATFDPASQDGIASNKNGA